MPLATKEAQRAYQLRWITARRDKWLQEHGPCIQCGSWDDLHVDHKDRSTKLMNPAVLWSMSETNSRRIEELAKCQVLCRRCHEKKTAAEQSFACDEHRRRKKRCTCKAG